MDKKFIESRMRLHENDTGSPMYQIGQLVCQISNIQKHISPSKYIESDLVGMDENARIDIMSDVTNKGNKKDFSATRSIKKKTSRIENLLLYAKKNKLSQYNDILKLANELGEEFKFMLRGTDLKSNSKSFKKHNSYKKNNRESKNS